MAKKFGKFVLFTAAAAAAGAGVYYYLKNKEALASDFDEEDEDYDDFSDDLEDETNRSYVALSHDGAASEDAAVAEADAEEVTEEAPFEKLSSIVSDAAETAEEKVEEFFDEEDEVSEEN